jgi:hypothetical protein
MEDSQIIGQDVQYGTRFCMTPVPDDTQDRSVLRFSSFGASQEDGEVQSQTRPWKPVDFNTAHLDEVGDRSAFKINTYQLRTGELGVGG